jgi:hypothetical protein
MSSASERYSPREAAFLLHPTNHFENKAVGGDSVLRILSAGVDARMNKLMLALASSVSVKEVFLWLGLLFLVLLGLVTLCQYFINCLVNALEAYDWLECRLAERKKRQVPPAHLHTVPSEQAARPANAGQSSNHAVPTTSRKRPLRANRHLRIVSAQEALRRNAESAQGLAQTK